MRRKFSALVFPVCAMLVFSCAGQPSPTFIPEPQDDYFEAKKNNSNNNINPYNIIETKGGAGRRLPGWLSAYINGGIEEVERMSAYSGKYVFIGRNEGVNFTAMNIWADNFSATRDFSILAAERIERRMISAANLYPDNEYGLFFETMVKKAYSASYTGAVKEDTYWIKMNTMQDNDYMESYTEVYNIFVLVSINKTTMQTIISDLMTESLSGVTPTAEQRNSINRLRQVFFEGF